MTYSFQNNVLVIEDPELDINLKDAFNPEPTSKHEKKEYLDGEGNLIECYYILDNLRDGKYELFYPNKAIKQRMFYKKGQLHGPSTFYSKEGKILAETWFYEDKQQGKAFWYYEGGQVYSEQLFKDGQRVGNQKYFDEKGNIRTTALYSHSKLDKAMLYRPDGSLKKEISG